MYAELAVTTNFSFLRGASHPEELVTRARRLGLTGIGIADRNSVAGVVRAHMAAQAAGMRLAVGARLVFADGTPDMLAFPRDRAAWGRLTRLLSRGKRRAEKGDCILYVTDLDDFISACSGKVDTGFPTRTCATEKELECIPFHSNGIHSSGLNLIVMAPPRIDAAALSALLTRLGEKSGHNIWLAASMLYRGDDGRRCARLADIAGRAGVPLIAVNDVLYHAPKRRALQDIVTCIREHVTIDAAGRLLEANAERHLKPPAEMARLFRKYPDAIRQTAIFLERCRFSLDELRHTEYPDETRKGFATPQDALVAFAQEGARRRYPDGIPDKVRHALAEELRLIGELNYAPFFLTVHDVVQFARNEKEILCQGRGSAANSVICYCLGITDVDPLKINLLFERFVSAERREPPDIDVDFEHERREEVIQHIYRTYSRERAGLAATVICYRGRSSIREVGKVFGLSEDTIGALAGSLWGWSMEGVTANETRRIGLDPSDRRLKMARSFARVLTGFPRHLSQHVGGFVITRSRLDEVVPIENAAMEDRTVIEWDKDDLDAVGLLKVDVLGLGMLSCLRRAFALMETHYGVSRDLSIQDEDEAVYRMIQRADTIGVFQIESRAQMSMLPRLKPKEFYDLVIEVAIVRPGPIQGDMVHPYLRRRQRLEPVQYHSPELEAILHKTLGVPLFQEHAMRIAIVAAGFAPAEADKLRRAMATFKRVGTIKYFRDKFINGMTSRGYPEDFARRCFSQIEGFGEYGFPESHAASFANLVYASAWIKCRYPDVFACALLNSQPMGFYAAAQIVRDAQEHGVEVRPVDINRSNWDCNIEPATAAEPVHASACPGKVDTGFPIRTCANAKEAEHIPIHSIGMCSSLHPRHGEMQGDIRATCALRLGLRQISGFSEADGLRIESVRRNGFDSVRDFWLRTGLSPAVIERLAAADAFRSLGLDRRDALWAVRALQRAGDKDDLPLFARVAMPSLEPDSALPPMLLGEQVVEDYRRLHLSLKAHPVAFLRAELARRGILRHAELPNLASGRRVSVGGLVLVRQRPGTAAGVIFMTLEDETAIANTIVWPKIYEAFRPVVLGARLLSVTGKLQSESGVIHVVAERIDDLTPLLSRLSQVQDTSCVEGLARADVKYSNGAPDPHPHRHPRAGDALVTLFRDQPALAGELGLTAEVMPKGRNFH